MAPTLLSHSDKQAEEVKFKSWQIPCPILHVSNPISRALVMVFCKTKMPLQGSSVNE